MKLYSSGIALVLVGLMTSTNVSAQKPPAPSVAQLQSDGWKVIERTEEQQRLPGIAPYENLQRVVQIVNYRLAKDGQELLCETTYDSQRDHYMEECSKPTL